MSASIPIPYAVGSRVWLARVSQDAEWVPCYACAGTLRHSVTLGNGETHLVACAECGADHRFDYDYDSSAHFHTRPGFTERHGIRVEVEEVTLTGVEVRGEEVNYTSSAPGGGRYIYRLEGLFATEEEARKHAAEVLVPAAQKAEDERLMNNLSHGRVTERTRKAAQSAAWWVEKRNKALEELAKIERRIARIKGGGK